MIKFFLPVLIVLTLAAIGLMFSTETKADSLVCYYSGTTKIMTVYTEESKSDEYKAVRTITVVNNWSRVTFHSGDDIYFSSAVPCIQIDDKRNDKTNLDEFYRHLR